MAKKKISKKSKPVKKPLLNAQWSYMIIGLISAGIYANTLGHDYVLDDAILITENAYTKKGIAGLKEIFTNDTFHGFFQKEGKDKLVSGGRYRPLSQAIFATQYSIFGLKPFIGHLSNIIAYALLVCTLFFLIKQFGSKYLPARENQLFAGTAALIFATHPVHTEVVANIKGLDEILALLFALWSIYFSYLFLRKKDVRWSVLAGLFLMLSLLSKESAIAFIFVIPLTLLFFTKHSFAQIAKASLYPVLFLGFYLIIRHQVVGLDMGGAQPLELMNNPFLVLRDGQYTHMSGAEKFPLVVVGICKYLQLLLFPHPLTHDYYPRFFQDIHLGHPLVLGTLFFIVVLLIISWINLRRHRIISYSIIFFFSTLFLTSNILFPIGTHLSERFLFAPSVAFALALSAALNWIRVKFGVLKSLFAAIVIMLLFSIKTIDRNGTWKDNYTLFTTDVETSHRSAKMQNAVGGVMISHAQTLTDSSRKNHELRQAIGHLQEAITIHPLYKNAYLLLGNAHYYLRDYAQAIEYFDKSLQLDPVYEEARYNRSIALRDFGRYYGEKLGDLSRALEYLKKAHAYLQDDYETLRLLGIAYGNLGEPQESVKYFKQALSLKPTDGWTHYNLGMAYLALQDSVNANHYISKAKTLNPDIGK